MERKRRQVAHHLTIAKANLKTQPSLAKDELLRAQQLSVDNPQISELLQQVERIEQQARILAKSRHDVSSKPIVNADAIH